MENFFARLALAAALGGLLISTQPVLAQGTAFTYQGQLQNHGSPASGSYDLTFALFRSSSGGSPGAGPLTNSATAVSNGQFTVALDFGDVFNGSLAAPNWLEIGVRTNGGSSFSTLAPRTQLTPVPYAIYSENSGAANTVIASSITAGDLSTAGSPAGGQVLTYNGSSLVWSNPQAGGGSSWSLTGNAGTMPGTDFLGTSDHEPLELWVNGARAFRLEPGGNVIGGTSNSVDPTVSGSATIAGGNGNTVGANSGNAPTIGGGQFNVVSNFETTVSGGEYNKALARAAVVGGGYGNTASGEAATVPGGTQSTAAGDYSLAAGEFAQALHSGAFVWADAEGSVFSSTANNQFNVRANGGVRFVTGGAGMTIDGVPVGTGGGGGGNTNYTISTVQTTNSGVFSSALGYQNTASGNYATVAGGWENMASGAGAFVGGGGYDGTTEAGNTASGAASVVGGGLGNNAPGNYATISGGNQNYANGAGGFVGGGGYDGSTIAGNTAGGPASTVGGGLQNAAFGTYDTVPGGSYNLASGGNSFAAGHEAQAINYGSFVWADATGGAFQSTNNDSFNVRAEGGVRFVTAGAGLTVDGQTVLTSSGGGTGSGAISPPVTIAGTTQTAAPNTSYVATNASTTTISLPTTANVGDVVQVSGTGAGGWQVDWQSEGNGTFLWTTETPAPTADWSSVASSADGTHLVAVLYGGQIYTSANSGVTWTNQTGAPSANWQSVASSSDGTHLVAVVHGGQIYTSANSGVTWTAQAGAPSASWDSVASSSDGTHLVAVGYGGQIYTSANSGVTWTAQAGAPSAYWWSVASSSDGTHLVAMVYDGQIYTSANSGVTWTAQAGAPSAYWWSVASSSDGTHLVAVVGGGQIYTSANSGVTWTAQAGAPTTIWQSVASSSDGTHLVAVVNGGQIYTSANSGVTWTAQAGAPTTLWESVASSSDGTHLVAVQEGGGGQIYTGVTTSGVVNGSPGSSEQFQYDGNGVWQPVQANGTWLANNGNLYYNGGNVGIGTATPANLLVVGSSGSPAYCNGTTWVNGSDRNSKEAFTAINPRTVLEKVSALPITEWQYKVETDSTRHLGPVAQDFHTAFGLNGADDKHIATVDEEGVALAAIQGLNQKLDEKDAEIQALKQSVSELKQLVQSLAAQK